MKRLLPLCFSLIFFTLPAVQAQVKINEFSCSNLNSYLNASGSYDDWVELYNASGAPVNLAGYYLSDDPAAPTKYAIPAGVTIPANGRVMVFCNDLSSVVGGQVNTSFKLTQTKNEKIVLANPIGAIIDSSSLYITQLGHSYGRKTDGAATWGYFDSPTPNTANTGAKNGYATKPIFDIQPGNYTTTQNISISSPDANVTVHYTLDGTVPTLASPVFSAPIVVSVTTVIKARAFSTDPLILPSFVETNTYLMNETTTMNVVSLTGDFNALFGSGQDELSSIEYFDKNHVFHFEMEGQVRPHGNDSWAYQQKGFRFHCKDELGSANSINYPLFTTSTRDTFGVIILKAAASDNFDGNGSLPSCHIRDAFAQTLAEKYHLDMDYRRYQPTIIYINGQYWGVYEIRERIDADFTDYYYGQPDKKIDMLRYWGGLMIDNGSDTAYNNLYNFIIGNNMAVASNYTHVTDALDVKSFIQYFIFNEYLVDTDWLDWNTMWWRGRKGNGVKWRFALWDEDNIMGLGQNFTGVGDVSYNNNPCDPIDLFQNIPSIMHTDMLNRLVNNPDFKQLYDQTWVDLLNGPFKCENITHHFDSLISIIQPEMQRQCTRWGVSYSLWQSNVAWTKDQILGRCAVIAGKLDTCLQLNIQRLAYNVVPAGVGKIAISGTTVGPYPGWEQLRADTTYQLQATATQQYYLFDHWEKYSSGDTLTADSLANPATFHYHIADSVVAVFRYYNPDSIQITFRVAPNSTGTIQLDGNTLIGYPHTVILNRNNGYTLKAVPAGWNKFVNWQKVQSSSTISPVDTDKVVTYHFSVKDTVTANFLYQPDPDSINVTFRVSPPGDGTINLGGNIIPTYPYTVRLDRAMTYSLTGQPANASRKLYFWQKWQPTSTFTPADTMPSVAYNYHDEDTVTAYFGYTMDPDSILVTFDVQPFDKGTITLEGNTISTYPYTVRLDRKNAYALGAAASVNTYRFYKWTKVQPSSGFSPSESISSVSYTFSETDTVIANFEEIPIPLNEAVLIPNAFSPNGDAKNDLFRIKGPDIAELDLKIFDRFGEMIFHTTNMDEGWDGKYKGVPCEVGTYYYTVKIKLHNRFNFNDEKDLKGDVILVR